jgi:hypothetical protein
MRGRLHCHHCHHCATAHILATWEVYFYFVRSGDDVQRDFKMLWMFLCGFRRFSSSTQKGKAKKVILFAALTVWKKFDSEPTSTHLKLILFWINSVRRSFQHLHINTSTTQSTQSKTPINTSRQQHRLGVVQYLWVLSEHRHVKSFLPHMIAPFRGLISRWYSSVTAALLGRTSR